VNNIWFWLAVIAGALFGNLVVAPFILERIG
jgi:hypothetical protein